MSLFPVREIYTVSEITARLKALLEEEFADVFIEGEISNFVAAASGHHYFVLKDKGAQIKCVCFRHKARYIKFRLEDGLKVIACGNLGVYEPRGEYQLYVEFLEPKGIGSLQLAFEQLKTKLQSEGLFDLERKRPLPVLPRTIGIVTSPTGAAIQDILRILRRRHQNVRVLIYPAKVQGEGAAQEIAAGIGYLNTLSDVDVMIVGRGGGSIEDLWAFNEEVVARAIFSSRIPVISAVGHETDFTIADFVADLRAPTPSAAAELVVLKKSEFTDRIASLEKRLSQSLQFHISQLRNRVLELSTDKVFASIEGKLRLHQQHLDELFFRLENAEELRVSGLKNQWRLLSTRLQRFDLAQRIRLKREALHHRWERAQAHVQFLLQRGKGKTSALAGALNALSPQAVLERGYAICYDSEGNALKNAESIHVGDLLLITLASGSIEGKAEKINPPGREAFNFAPPLEEAHDKDHGF